jgi:molybdate transport repressor ModE-like protein
VALRRSAVRSRLGPSVRVKKELRPSIPATSGRPWRPTQHMAGEWWSGIELRHLAALDAVAREGSFRRAATRLGYVQSAISHQIAALETLTGKRLIERSRGTRPLALTEAGEILLAHADAVIARVRAAQADLAALDGDHAVLLRAPRSTRESIRESG